jgi:predicted transcriptional regulator of viral defense system
MSRDTARTLRAVAAEQGGYFTAKQALAAGYHYPHLDYHASVGNIERVSHGLYRFADMPRGESDDFVRLTLWSRDRADAPQAVVSHESALSVHDLGELIPNRIHLTVPPKFRKVAPPGVVLHAARLSPDDVEERTGFRVTSPLRTLLDAAAAGVSQEQLDKAVADALSRGLVRRPVLEAATRQSARYTRLKPAVGRRSKAPA